MSNIQTEPESEEVSKAIQEGWENDPNFGWATRENLALYEERFVAENLGDIVVILERIERKTISPRIRKIIGVIAVALYVVLQVTGVMGISFLRKKIEQQLSPELTVADIIKQIQECCRVTIECKDGEKTIENFTLLHAIHCENSATITVCGEIVNPANQIPMSSGRRIVCHSTREIQTSTYYMGKQSGSRDFIVEYHSLDHRHNSRRTYDVKFSDPRYQKLMGDYGNLTAEIEREVTTDNGRNASSMSPSEIP